MHKRLTWQIDIVKRKALSELSLQERKIFPFIRFFGNFPGGS